MRQTYCGPVVVSVMVMLSACAQQRSSANGPPLDDKAAVHQLTHAVIAGRLDETKRLASRPSAVNAVDPADATARTPLMFAIEWSRADLVRALLLLKADPSRRDANGFTAGDYALGSVDRAIQEALPAAPSASG